MPVNDAGELIFRHLDTNGDGTGTKNANGDYSGAAEEFYFQYPRNDNLSGLIEQYFIVQGYEVTG